MDDLKTSALAMAVAQMNNQLTIADDLGLTSPILISSKLSFSELPLWVMKTLSVTYVILPFNTGLTKLLKFTLSWLWFSPFYGSQPCVTPPSSTCFPLLPSQGINFRFIAKGNNHFYKKQNNPPPITGKAQKVWFSIHTNSVRTLEKKKVRKLLKPTWMLLSHWKQRLFILIIPG